MNAKFSCHVVYTTNINPISIKVGQIEYVEFNPDNAGFCGELLGSAVAKALGDKYHTQFSEGCDFKILYRSDVVARLKSCIVDAVVHLLEKA